MEAIYAVTGLWIICVTRRNAMPAHVDVMIRQVVTYRSSILACSGYLEEDKEVDMTLGRLPIQGYCSNNHLYPPSLPSGWIKGMHHPIAVM
jgi:hypothetical protein